MRRHRARVLLLLPLSPPPRTTPGATTAPAGVVRLTVAEAVARAREDSPRLGQLSALERRRGAGARRQRGAMAQLDLVGRLHPELRGPRARLFAPATLGAPVERIVVFPNIPDNWRPRAGIALPLYTGGRIERAIDAAAAESRRRREDRAPAATTSCSRPRAAYWSLVTAREAAGRPGGRGHIRGASRRRGESRTIRHGGPQRGPRGPGRARPR